MWTKSPTGSEPAAAEQKRALHETLRAARSTSFEVAGHMCTRCNELHSIDAGSRLDLLSGAHSMPPSTGHPIHHSKKLNTYCLDSKTNFSMSNPASITTSHGSVQAPRKVPDAGTECGLNRVCS